MTVAQHENTFSEGLADCRALTPERLRGMGKGEARAIGDALFARLGDLDPGDREHGLVRGTLVELNMPLVRWVAGRYRHRSEPMDDITQTGVVGLIKAVDAYDPGRGVEFASFAIPTISGEIKRFFRDTTWPVHVGRGAQELYLSVVKASDDLEQRRGGLPTTQQIAEHLDITEEDVEEGWRASRASVTAPLDAPAETPDGEASPLVERLASIEPGYDLAEFRVAVRPLIGALPRRERDILRMRFWEERTQSQIAERIGVSQMHVSRILAAVTTRLREQL